MLLPSCGGGGGGGSGGSTAPVQLSATTAQAGQVAPLLATTDVAPSTVWEVSWRDSSAMEAAVGSATAVNSRVLALVVPTTLAAGSYEARLSRLGTVEMTAPVTVLAAPVVADPPAYVADFQLEIAASQQALSAAIAKETDPVRQAAMQSDLARMQSLTAQLESSLATATSQQIAELAALLALQRPVESSGATEGAEFDPIREADWAKREAERAALKAAQATVTTVAGVALLIPPNTLLGAATILLGVKLWIDHILIVEGILGRSLSILDYTIAMLSESTSITIPSGDSAQLQASGGVATLSRQVLAATSSSDLRLAGASLDAIVGSWQSMADAVRSWLDTPPLPIPASSQTVQQAVSWQRMALVAQSNPRVTLSLDGSSLSASTQSATTETTTATFRLTTGTGSSIDRQVQVVVEIGSLPNIPGMVRINPGTFQMGSNAPIGQPPYYNQAQAQPVHPVTITRPFLIGQKEVTQAQYQAVMGTNPSSFPGANRPVEQVSWNNAMAYCAALTASEAAQGRVPSGYQYRLPTEAEWEYCCRAGTTTEFSVGPSLTCGMAHFSYSYHSNSSCGGQFGQSSTANVGSYPANPWGLFDMHGNVWEWCLDSWDGSANYPSSAVSDPYVSSGPVRVVRGGSWYFGSNVCRSAGRSYYGFPDGAYFNFGFRVCLPQFSSPSPEENQHQEPARRRRHGGPSGAGPEMPEP